VAVRRKSAYQSERLKRVINRDAIIISHVIIGSIAAIDILYEAMPTSTKVSAILVLALFSMLGISRFFNLFNINKYTGTHLVLYHLLISIGLMWFAPLGSLYVSVWLIIIFLTNFYYGVRKTFTSLLLLLVVLEVQLLRSSLVNGSISSDALLTSVGQFFIIVAISMFFIDTQSVNDQDKALLQSNIKRAQLARERLVSLINSMTDGVLAIDEKGRIKLFNASALNVLDTNIDLEGKDIHQFMSIIDAKNKRLDLLAWAATGKSAVQSTEYRLKYRDGEIINLYLNVSPIKLGYKRDDEHGYIVSFRDITREKSLEEERDEFISVISHELRTPVAITEASISNARFLMSKGTDRQVMEQSLDAAYKQVLFLANMLNDITTLSRAERGKLDFVPERISPVEVLEGLYQDYRTEVESKKLEWFMHADDGTPPVIVSNKLYMREVLQNFITNSVKYTPSGSVTISVGPAEKGGVIYKVTDTGIGISKSDQHKIFNKFFRSEDFRTRESSGTGLGLYITKKLARLLEAQISVESQINKGTTFSILIPDMSSKYPGAKGPSEPAPIIEVI
jgi:two-component system phosphate regulon sensor histidine kinase PhoR